jgi:hypothetical protein
VRGLFREFVVAKRKSERDYDGKLTLAWHTAVMHSKAKAGKLPSLREVLVKSKSTYKQTPNEQRATVYQFAAQMGKSVGKTKLVRVPH